jgi:hypothetical protein
MVLVLGCSAHADGVRRFQPWSWPVTDSTGWRTFPHQLLVPAPFHRRRTGCNGCAAEELVRRRGSGAAARKWCGGEEVVRRRGTGAADDG